MVDRKDIYKLRRHDFTSQSLCNVNGGPSVKLLRAANRCVYAVHISIRQLRKSTQ